MSRRNDGRGAGAAAAGEARARRVLDDLGDRLVLAEDEVWRGLHAWFPLLERDRVRIDLSDRYDTGAVLPVLVIDCQDAYAGICDAGESERFAGPVLRKLGVDRVRILWPRADEADVDQDGRVAP